MNKAANTWRDWGDESFAGEAGARVGEHTQDGWPPRGATCSWYRVLTGQVDRGGKCNLGSWPVDCSRGYDLKSGAGGKRRDMWRVGSLLTFTQGSPWLSVGLQNCGVWGLCSCFLAISLPFVTTEAHGTFAVCVSVRLSICMHV